MSKKSMRTQEARRHWAGLDWGRDGHAVSVVDDERALAAQFKTSATLEGLKDLAKQLRSLGAVSGVAIESTREPVVDYLLMEGFTVYLVNPKLSRNWRAGNSVADVKSDVRDGFVLAVELARRHESLRPLKKHEPAVAQLEGLCEKTRALIDQRTELVQRLKATLRAYYPAALEFFGDWTSPVAWRFLKRFPTPQHLAGARKDTLIKFLKANRIGLKPVWLERIERRGEATAWPQPQDHLSLQGMAMATVAQLMALEPYINQNDKLIARQCEALPTARLLRSLPGAGDRLAPALTAMTMLMSEEPERLQALRCLSGVAPVQNQSGKRCHAQMRRRCNKYWRDVLHLFAYCSTQCCPWARAYYTLCRERGDNFATALRKLADKWLKIIDRMLDTNQPYDEQRYLQALRKSASPVYQKMCEMNRGKLTRKCLT